MTLNELRYIVAVAQERNFGRAAARCFVSQPALSVAILKLEEELGTTLFERRKTDISITAAGEHIIQQAQRVLEEAQRLKDIAAQGADPLQGPFRLGVIFTVAPYLLPDLVPALHARAPAMPLDIEENLTDNLAPLLTQGRLDALIIALPFVLPGVMVDELYEEPFQVVVPYRHPWAKRHAINPRELSEQHCILLNVGNCFRNQVLDSCPELNRSGKEGPLSNSLETVRNMVASGLGVSVLPAGALTPKYHSKLVVPVPFTEPAPARRIALAYRRGFPRQQAIAAIKAACQMIELPYARSLVRETLSTSQVSA